MLDSLLSLGSGALSGLGNLGSGLMSGLSGMGDSLLGMFGGGGNAMPAGLAGSMPASVLEGTGSATGGGMFDSLLGSGNIGNAIGGIGQGISAYNDYKTGKTTDKYINTTMANEKEDREKLQNLNF